MSESHNDITLLIDLISVIFKINMVFPLAVIVCSIIFGLLFILQTGYFLYKLIKCRQVDQSGEKSSTTIPISDAEGIFCLGWIWTFCMDEKKGRMPLKVFIAWYIVALCFDILAVVLLSAQFSY